MSSLTDKLQLDSDANVTLSNPGSASIWTLYLGERSAGLFLTLIVIYLHAFNFSRVGGLWRDEANSVTMALLPDFSRFWSALQYDSFPVIHYLVIRSWSFLFGSADTSLRFMGLTVGVLFVAALWCKAASFGKKAPIISLLLIGMNPLAIRFLDSVRPYGLAALTIVLSFTVVWRMLRNYNLQTLVLATVILIFTVQILFQSAIFVLAIGISAILTAFMQGGLRRAVKLTLPFLFAALSLVPYLSHLQKSKEWSPVAMAPPASQELFKGLLRLINVPFPWMMLVWFLFMAVTVFWIVFATWRSYVPRDIDPDTVAQRLYCSLTLVISATLYILFLAGFTGISPKAWHYLPLLVLMVISAESLIDECLMAARLHLFMIVFVLVIAVSTFYHSSKYLQVRFTSMDIVAAAISSAVSANDLVVVMPWFYGVSFNRYYNGIAPWVSFPSLREKSLHRFDMIKERIAKPEMISADLEIITTTLKKGGKVWIIGSAYAMQPGKAVLLLPPAPLPKSGWSSSPYLDNWTEYLSSILATHTLEGEQLAINTPEMLIPYEAPAIRVYQGYKD